MFVVTLIKLIITFISEFLKMTPRPMRGAAATLLWRHRTMKLILAEKCLHKAETQCRVQKKLD